MATRPNTFVIGAPKCATTSLVEALRELKEPGIFGSNLDSLRQVV